jgi:hypothetical protein
LSKDAGSWPLSLSLAVLNLEGQRPTEPGIELKLVSPAQLAAAQGRRPASPGAFQLFNRFFGPSVIKFTHSIPRRPVKLDWRDPSRLSVGGQNTLGFLVALR